MITIHRISHRIYRYLGIVGIHIAGSLSILGSGWAAWGGDGDTDDAGGSFTP